MRFVLIVIAAVLAILLIGPLIVPIPPLKDTVPVEQLADQDSQFIEVNGLNVHYKMAGQGEPVIILMHGFGASTFSWREVMPPLSTYGTVIAYDRPAFGLTERPLPGEWSGENPYSMDAQVKLTIGLMDALGVEKAVLIGNSAGGTISAETAINYPDRVEGLVLVDAAIYGGGGAPAWMHPMLTIPQINRLGPWFVRSLAGKRGMDFLQMAWHDPSHITPEILAGYRKPLHAKNWDTALWELTKASQASELDDQLKLIELPTLVITGDDDRIIPPEDSIRLSVDLPSAKLVVIQNCGHLPQEEQPQAFMDAVISYLSNRGN